ncbi:hypothetical protein SPONN_1138 [uncultured Candidatus Thioglobus sp.]|nr:hypothetical protein SPONN_1138 [uncultured Candidatus Thioglobus sp.]
MDSFLVHLWAKVILNALFDVILLTITDCFNVRWKNQCLLG